jgi:hypothetical protein
MTAESPATREGSDALRRLAEAYRDAERKVEVCFGADYRAAEYELRDAGRNLLAALTPAVLLALLESAERWEAVRDSSYICSAGAHRDYYISGQIIPGDLTKMPTVTEAADAFRASRGRTAP